MLEVNKVWLELCQDLAKAGLYPTTQKCVKELARSGCSQSLRVAGDPVLGKAVFVRFVPHLGWAIWFVVPVEHRDLVPAAESVGQALGVDFHATEGAGGKLV